MAKFYSSAVPEYQADKEQFEFVQMKDDIADATFQDKPIGFFKDAGSRECWNSGWNPMADESTSGQPGRYNTLSGRQHSESHQLPEGPGRGYV